MGSKRTAWHVLLDVLLRQQCPRSFEVRSEVPLSHEPLRPDYLLLRRRPASRSGNKGKTLRRLWEWLPADAIAEFKSVGRPYRSRNLHRLWSYLHIHYANEPKRLRAMSDLCGVLLVPAKTRSLEADVAAQGLSWHDKGGGYWELLGGAFSLYVVEIKVVAEAEQDDRLRLLGRRTAKTVEGERWFAEQVGSKEVQMALHKLEGFDEVMRTLLKKLPPEQVLAGYKPEERLAGLSPEQVLAGYKPEERLAGLSPEEVLAAYKPEERLAGLSPQETLLALPVEVLAGLSDTYLDSLPEPLRAAIRARIAAPRAKAERGKARKPGRTSRRPAKARG